MGQGVIGRDLPVSVRPAHVRQPTAAERSSAAGL